MSSPQIHCSECEATFVVIFDEVSAEGELIYCPFCGEKLNLKDETPKPDWAWQHDDDDEG